jgi:uncharacterized protein
MKEKYRWSLVAFIVDAVVLGAIFAPAITQAAPKAVKIPKVIPMTSYEVGSTGYVVFGHVGEALIKKFGTKLRVIPLGTNIARMTLLRSGQVQFAGEGGDIYFAGEGLGRYSTREWGPQAFRIAWAGLHPGVTGWVRKNSDIHTCADLKGKRVVWVPGSIVNKQAEAMLAFGGLTFDDVKKVEFPSYGASMQAIIDGTADFATGACSATKVYELDASPYGIRYLQMPEEDKEGWTRVKKIMPMWVPFKATIGAALSESSPLECGTYGYPTTVCYPNLDEDIAYFMTKAIHEGYDIMAAASKIMKAYWGINECLSLFENSNILIFHPGSVRYFKDIDVWKPHYDELQRERIANQEKIKEIWDETVDKALDEGIKDKEFAEFWLKRRAAALEE